MTATAISAISPASSPAVGRLLEAIAAGRGGDIASLYAPGAVLDATVPDWRFTRRGPAAIADQYRQWFADPGRFEELTRLPTPTGETVVYELAWEEGGMPHAAHHCHVLDVDPATGLITRERFFCGGRWNATALAAMAEAQAKTDAADAGPEQGEPGHAG